ncbi:hypothetical protein F5X97DRAFT_300200 [Nemania serpens]|nr:hypothetical protein F5X97DRAFT_300200 [Nemania serpens]
MATLCHPRPVLYEGSHLKPIFLVLLSVQILGQTLFHSVMGLNRLMLNGHATLGNYSTQLVDLLLIRSGWCRLDFMHLPKDPIFRFYLAYLNQRSCLHQRNRRESDGETCSNHSNIQGTTSAPKHTHRQCLCPFISAPTNNFSGTASSRHIGLYTYREHHPGSRGLDQQAAELYDMEHTAPYVAVSHVRSLGLGNDEENSLPHCQLSLLQALVNQVVHPCQESSNTLFWIDTLALPVDQKARKVAIRSIPLIFTRASAVLVLDPTLYEHVFVNAEEAMLRIRYSLWKSRLWTLEEGFYAQRLVFRFSNALISLEELLSRLQPTLISVAGRIDKYPSTLDLIRNEDLERTLTRFASDIHLAIELGSDDVDKEYLYRVLRAGYLLSRKFSLCVERNEWDFQREVIPKVFDVYGTQEHLDPNAHSLSRRLATISKQRYIQ